VYQSYPWGSETAIGVSVRSLPSCLLELAALLKVLSVGSSADSRPTPGALMSKMKPLYLMQPRYHFTRISSSAAPCFLLVLES